MTYFRIGRLRDNSIKMERSIVADRVVIKIVQKIAGLRFDCVKDWERLKLDRNDDQIEMLWWLIGDCLTPWHINEIGLDER